MRRVRESLEGKFENHIYPFFWQHGESEEVLREYMGKIDESGCKAVCVESRPHPDFVGEKWWEDMRVIIDEAKKREMKVWILDDSHFPTGYANGEIERNYPQFRKIFLKSYQLDFVGPVKKAEAIISYALSDKEDQLFGVMMAKKLDYNTVDPETLTDITEGVVENRSVRFELPEGEWRIFILVKTYKGGEPHTENYLNPMDPHATDILIQTVYESHYEKFSDEFGKTILGFFTDEPRFGNIHGHYASIGRCEMVLPWVEGLEKEFSNRVGFDVNRYLPLLFTDGGAKAHEMRYAYMDLVSDLYAENFSQRLGTWCEEHGVEYIGHVIEENNAHARLGGGAGHFYKSMKGQHMAGIDVVLHQLLPGLDHGIYKGMTARGWDGEFLHYCLAKQGASLGRLDPKKQGRTMCEVFGAYGWAEGTKTMKWITDHMLVRGVNEFVPHAFDPMEYPDPDCPPHFYARGKNPQFREFCQLMEYMNRMAHILSGGKAHAPAAVLYHGEAEWSGEYMLTQKPAAYLCRNQIDYEILPWWAVRDGYVENGKLKIRDMSPAALVIPYAEALPAELIRSLCRHTAAGLEVIFIDGMPERSSEGEDISEELQCLEKQVHVLSLEEMVPYLREKKICEISPDHYEPYLRYYHYEQEDGHIYMLVNEAPYDQIHTTVSFPQKEPCCIYDAMKNELRAVHETQTEDGTEVEIHLHPYEAVVLLFSDKCEGKREESSCEDSGEKDLTMWFRAEKEAVSSQCLSGPYDVSFIRSESYPQAEDTMRMEELIPLQEIRGKENFTGVIRYELSFTVPDSAQGSARSGGQEDGGLRGLRIVLDGVEEAARVYVNGTDCGSCMCPPYRYDITHACREGENVLAVEVTTTLARDNYDWLSQYMLLEKTGLTGSIILEEY